MHADVTVAADKPVRQPRPWYTQLWAQVMAAMVLGVALGHFYPDLSVRLQPLGDESNRNRGRSCPPTMFKLHPALPWPK